MIKSVGEGLGKYIQELKDYKTWTDGLAKQYDIVYGKDKWNAEQHFDTRELEELHRRSARLQGMVSALGLTKEEEVAIDKECGIKSQEELKAT